MLAVRAEQLRKRYGAAAWDPAARGARSCIDFHRRHRIRGMSTIDFEQIAAELERFAAQIRRRSELNQSFAERIESLAREMRQEVNLRVIRGRKA
jgi:truncated hemoglobin YjbI